MKSNQRIRLARLFLSVALVIGLVSVRGTHAGDEPFHLTSDWSHHHLVFSAPRSLAEHFRLLSNPRYVHQLLARDGSRNRNVDNFRWYRAPLTPNALNRDWSEDMGSGATVGAGNYPAKYSFFAGTANCASATVPDFVAYNTSLAGSTTRATIVAFDNLYSGCATGSVPSTYWAFNTGTGDSVVTSPTLSFDGKQVAFMQSAGAAASLVLLRWAAGSGTLASPLAPAPETPTNYYNSGTGCTAPCMTTIAFADGDSDTTSSPFYDYTSGSDTLYVGDASGKLHKFHPVFSGVPAEVTTGGFPFTMATAPLSSPVYDSATGLVIATAAFSTTNNGGRLHTLCATGTTCGTVGVTTTASGILGPSTTGGTCQTPGAGGTSGDTANLALAGC